MPNSRAAKSTPSGSGLKRTPESRVTTTSKSSRASSPAKPAKEVSIETRLLRVMIPTFTPRVRSRLTKSATPSCRTADPAASASASSRMRCAVSRTFGSGSDSRYSRIDSPAGQPIRRRIPAKSSPCGTVSVPSKSKSTPWIESERLYGNMLNPRRRFCSHSPTPTDSLSPSCAGRKVAGPPPDCSRPKA